MFQRKSSVDHRRDSRDRTKVAELLAESGRCDVAMVYRHDKISAEAAKKAVEAHNVTALTIQADLSKEESIPEIIAQVKERFDRLDYLVSNAVFGVLKPIGQFTSKRFDASMNTNAKAYLLLAQAAAELMVPEGSAVPDLPQAANKRIVALSSLGSSGLFRDMRRSEQVRRRSRV